MKYYDIGKYRICVGSLKSLIVFTFTINMNGFSILRSDNKDDTYLMLHWKGRCKNYFAKPCERKSLDEIVEEWGM